MIFALVPLLMMALVNQATAQKALKYTKTFPQDWKLVKGDTIDLITDNYLNVKGASFEPKTNMVPKILLDSNRFLTLPTLIDTLECNLVSSASTSGLTIMVCGDKTFYRATVDHNKRTINPVAETFAVSVELKTAEVAVAQVCADMIFHQNMAYILCTQSATKIVVYTVDFNMNNAAINMQFKEFTVTGDIELLKGYLKLSLLFVNSADKSVKLVAFQTVATIETAKPMAFLLIDISATNVPTGITTVDVKSLLADDTWKGTINTIHYLDNEKTFIVGGSSDKIKIAVLKLSGTSFTKNDIYVPLSWSPVTTPFVGIDHQCLIEPAPNGQEGLLLSVFGTDMYHEAIINATIDDATKKVTLVMTNVVTNTFDCGKFESGEYMGKVTRINPTEASMIASRRTVIEFKNSNHILIAIGVHFFKDNYGCLKDPAVKAVVLFDSKMMFSAIKGKFQYYSLGDKNSMRWFTKDLTAADPISVTVGASLNGYDSTSQVLKYKLVDKIGDFNDILTSATKFDAYAGSVFDLPVAGNNFGGNNPAYTTKAENTKIYTKYAQKIDPTWSAALPTEKAQTTGVFSYDKHFVVITTYISGNQYATLYAITDDEKDLAKPTSALTKRFQYKIDNSNDYVYKVFGLSNTHLCIVTKSINLKKLEINCMSNAASETAPAMSNRKIDDTREYSNIEVYNRGNRADLILIGAKTDSTPELIYYSVDLNDKTIQLPSGYTTIDIKISEVTTSLNYYPTDVMYDFNADSESINHLVIKFEGIGIPIITKYAIAFTGSSVTLTYLHKIYVKNQNFIYCNNMDEAVIFNPRAQILYSKEWEGVNGIFNNNEYVFNFADYNIAYIKQLVCVPEKSAFQILAIGTDKNKYLMTFTGGNSYKGDKRVHSVVSINSNAFAIDTGSSLNSQTLTTFVAHVVGSDLKAEIVHTYLTGPFIRIDNTGIDKSYKLSISVATSSTKTVEKEFDITIIDQKLEANVTAKTKFESKANANINLDDFTTIDGPVLDVVATGDSKAAVNLTQRINAGAQFGAALANVPDKISVKNDFMVTLSVGKYLRISYDPDMNNQTATATDPALVYEETANNLIDVLLFTSGTSKNSIAIVKKSWANSLSPGRSTYRYDLHYLQEAAATAEQKFVITTVKEIFQLDEDYESMAATVLDNGNIVLALKSQKGIATQYLNLMLLEKGTSPVYEFKGKQTSVSSSYLGGIVSYSLMNLNEKEVVIFANGLGMPNLQVVKWDGVVDATKPLTFSEVPLDVISGESTLKLSLRKLYCWKTQIDAKAQCFFDSEGIKGRWVEVEFQAVEGSPIVKSFKSLKELYFPPGFEITKIERNDKYLGVLLHRIIRITPAPAPVPPKLGAASLGAANTIDKIDDCNNMIAIYDPLKSSFVFTGITCSNWGKIDNVDFTMASLSEVNLIWFTKATPAPAPTLSSSGLAQTPPKVSINRVSPLTLTIGSDANFDAKKVALKFVGFKGPETTNSILLSDLQVGKPAEESSGSFWIWFMVILILLIAAGGAGYFFYMKSQQGGSSSSGSYKKTDVKDSKTDDLDDSRL